MKKIFGIVGLVSVAIIGCKPSQVTAPVAEVRMVNLDTVEVRPEIDTVIYHGSDERVVDLLHTALDVTFDWKKSQLNGKATLTLKPYFYEISSFEIDAKGFDIHSVGMKKNDSVIALEYTYDSLILDIKLKEILNRKDTFELFIAYTAKPNDLAAGGSAAITSDKGLYFINPLGEDKEKPQQIWTQGETEASSCWFPTVDSPNEKTTFEIYMTVQDKYKTLSNGSLIYQTENPDGTRTDYWKQMLPHAPYLTMMAVGDFFVYEDKWRDSVQVNYLVEHEYGPYAKQIFGKTPEMMEFFSQKMGVDYPWDKYSQVVVRDYVSGAMENTSAVIHGDFLHQTAREMLDGDNQDIIAHELFHHWFGDLVTCESWSNLPLNESFATYGEYLWKEHAEGKEAADHKGQGDLRTYLQESRYKQEDLIRYNYEDKEDMFDSHSYAKGGRILHMLRNIVGDEAFFESLKVYLTRMSYKTAEIHDLRSAFEDVTGSDLNWFFNEWFMASGHPDLLITYNYVDSTNTQNVTIEQKQDLETTPQYRLPIEIDIYTKDGVRKENVVLYKRNQTFVFKDVVDPKLVNVDAQKMLLCTKKDKKDISQFIYQYNHAPLYLDRYEAVRACSKYARKDSLALEVVFSALSDKNKSIRALAMKNLKQISRKKKDALKTKLIDLALNDKSTGVQATAVTQLAKYYSDDDDAKAVFDKTVKMQSYRVIARSLAAISASDSEKALALAGTLTNEKSASILLSVAGIYAVHGTEEHHQFFMDSKASFTGWNLLGFIPVYKAYLLKDRSDELMLTGVEELKNLAVAADMTYVNYYAVEAMTAIKQKFDQKSTELSQEIDKLNAAETPDSGKINDKNLERDRVILNIKKISAAMEQIEVKRE